MSPAASVKSKVRGKRKSSFRKGASVAIGKHPPSDPSRKHPWSSGCIAWILAASDADKEAKTAAFAAENHAENHALALARLTRFC